MTSIQLDIIPNTHNVPTRLGSYRIIETEYSYLDISLSPDLDLLNQCVADIRDKLIHRPGIIVAGRQGIQRRNIGLFSEPGVSGYKYSTYELPAQALTPNLNLLLNKVNEIFQSNYNGILVNQYMDGSDTLGAHSDNEQGLDPIGVVAISWGITRNFRVRNKRTGAIVMDIPFQSGDMMIMGGNFQKEFTHEIPVQKRIKGERISFTFRKHLYVTHDS